MIIVPLLLAAAATTAQPDGKTRPAATPSETKTASATVAPTNDVPAFATDPFRNPFWPESKFQDYILTDAEAITNKPIIEIDVNDEDNPAQTAASVSAAMQRKKKAEEAQKEFESKISRQTWATAALKSFKNRSVITSRTPDGEKTAYQINGKVYTYGDYISANYNGHRFTWQICPGQTPRRPHFKPIRVRPIPPESAPKPAAESAPKGKK